MTPSWFDKLLLFLFRPILEEIKMEHAELIAILSALNAQLSKVAAEINGKLDELADALDEADNLPEEPEPEPEPEPPVEE